jgi:putative acetyltransferase
MGWWVVSEGDGIVIELAPSVTDEVRALVDELELTLAAEYPPEQRHGLALEALFQPHIRFFVARLNGAAVGCGGVALFTDFAEVKRMYVRDGARGRGVAQAMLACIEDAARDAGLRVLRLETGDQQVAAMRLYERAGFRRCAAFGDYAAMVPQAIATSVFFEKGLSDSTG